MKLEITPSACWLANHPVDFRRGIDGLCQIVLDQLGHPLQAGVFVFYSKDRKKIKVLSWHRNGFILIYKRLAKGKLTYSLTPHSQRVVLNKQQLSWLLAGLDWQLMSACTDLPFTDYY